MKLCHMAFVDDLILFCKGDFFSMYMLLRGFTTFFSASDVEANKGKSKIYCCNMDQETIL